MPQNNENCNTIEPFLRNRYFYGKLLTVRDFEDEQRYNIGKVRLSNRFNFGSGIICGLEISVQENITVSPGIAVDRCGNFIIVPFQINLDIEETEQFGNRFYLFIKYAENEMEPVFSPVNSSQCEEVCENNRIKESFLTYFSDTLPEEKPFTAIISRAKDPEKIIKDLGILYYNKHLKECSQVSDNGVLLAVLKRENNSISIDTEETEKKRKIVFTNNMLRDITVSHISDLENPHGSLKTINSVGNTGNKKVSNINIVPTTEKDITVKPIKNKNEIEIGISEKFKKTIYEKIENIKCIKSINNLKSEDIFITSQDNSVKIVSKGKNIDLSVHGTSYEKEMKKVLQETAYQFDMIGLKFPRAKNIYKLSGKIYLASVEALKENIYRKTEKFIDFIKEISEFESNFNKTLKREYENLRIPKERIENLIDSFELLKESLESKELEKIIEAKQDYIFFLSLIRPEIKNIV
ncbi:hypothetical protein [Persephonella sp.]